MSSCLSLQFKFFLIFHIFTYVAIQPKEGEPVILVGNLILVLLLAENLGDGIVSTLNLCLNSFGFSPDWGHSFMFTLLCSSLLFCIHPFPMDKCSQSALFSGYVFSWCIALSILQSTWPRNAFDFLVSYNSKTKCGCYCSSGVVRLHRGLRVEFVLGVVPDLNRQPPMRPHPSKLRPSAARALSNHRNGLQVLSASGNATTRQRRSFWVYKKSGRASERIPAVNANEDSFYRTGVNSATCGY